jgi:hypothetical protein
MVMTRSTSRIRKRHVAASNLWVYGSADDVRFSWVNHVTGQVSTVIITEESVYYCRLLIPI